MRRSEIWIWYNVSTRGVDSIRKQNWIFHHRRQWDRVRTLESCQSRGENLSGGREQLNCTDGSDSAWFLSLDFEQISVQTSHVRWVASLCSYPDDTIPSSSWRDYQWAILANMHHQLIAFHCSVTAKSRTEFSLTGRFVGVLPRLLACDKISQWWRHAWVQPSESWLGELLTLRFQYRPALLSSL